MKIAIGSDHVGYLMKNHFIGYLHDKGYEVIDCGTFSSDRCDYPVFGQRVALEIKNGKSEFGILICGTGVGISLAANKVAGIRAAVCSEPYTAAMAHTHNNANIIAFGARVVDETMAEQIVDAFLNSHFEGGRHQNRIEMLEKIEKGEILG